MKEVLDRYVGARIRLRRLELNLSQESLANALGVSFQQVQKYEKGVNRISAGRLQAAAQFLRVVPTYFLEGGEAAQQALAELGEEAADLSLTLDSHRFLTAFQRLENADLRRSIVDLVETIIRAQRGPTGAAGDGN